MTLHDGPWLIGDHSLHVQRWQPNFLTKMAEITHLPIWIHFPMLPVKHYYVNWLQRVRNLIGKTLKVDSTTLQASRGRFACVCVEVDLCYPLESAYHLKRRSWKLQYKGLQVVCYKCGCYDHGTVVCPQSP